MRALAEVGGNAWETVSDAGGVRRVCTQAAPSLNWRVEGVGGVSGSTGVSGDEDPVARRWLLPDGDHVHLSNFLLSKM